MTFDSIVSKNYAKSVCPLCYYFFFKCVEISALAELSARLKNLKIENKKEISARIEVYDNSKTIFRGD